MNTMMKVVVSSKETIKPSSPTPHHLRHLQLSFLDQLNHRYLASYIYYYASANRGAAVDDNIQRSKQLKKSLSETLTRFYPLAGRVKDLFVDCNDEGVTYSEAQVEGCRLSQVLAQPNHYQYHAQLNKLLPCDQLRDAGDITLVIQVNFFACGGMAIGMCYSHKIMDALSFITFVNFWAALARGEGDAGKLVSPTFDLPALSPPRDMSSYELGFELTDEKELIGKSFLFSTSAIADLKSKYTQQQKTDTITPTSVEALSTFIWRRFVAATEQKKKSGKIRSYIIIQAVNLRTRFSPALVVPDTTFGNLNRFFVVKPSMDNNGGEEGGYGLVTQMRDAVRKIDGNYVKKLVQDGEWHPIDKGDQKLSTEGSEEEEEVPLIFSSMWRFPLYEADYGWGKPRWVGMAARPVKNGVVFFPTPSNNGIEAWFNMTEEDMALLEADEDFLAFVSPTTGLEFPA